MMSDGLKELIGCQCRAEFNLPPSEWPVSGWPAWILVEDVDMPLIKIKSRWEKTSLWVNATLFKTIESVDNGR